MEYLPGASFKSCHCAPAWMLKDSMLATVPYPGLAYSTIDQDEAEAAAVPTSKARVSETSSGPAVRMAACVFQRGPLVAMMGSTNGRAMVSSERTFHSRASFVIRGSANVYSLPRMNFIP